jgi:hypothetical protein
VNAKLMFCLGVGVILLLGVLVSLSSILPDNKLHQVLAAPIDIFSDSTCAKSCWRGLQVGQSTVYELIGFMDALYGSFATVNTRNFADNEVTIFEPQQFEGLSVTLIAVEGKLEKIYLSPKGEAVFALTINDIFGALNVSQYVNTYTLTILNADGNAIPQITGRSRLFFPENGYVFTATSEVISVDQIDNVCPRLTDHISEITVTQSGTIDQTLLALDVNSSIPYFSSGFDLVTWSDLECEHNI